MKRMILFIISVLCIISCTNNKKKADITTESMLGDSVFSTKRILKGNMIITRVFHAPGNRWYFNDDSSNINLEERAIVMSFDELLKKDSSLIKIINMPIDYMAERKNIHEKWEIKKLLID